MRIATISSGLVLLTVFSMAAETSAPIPPAFESPGGLVGLQVGTKLSNTETESGLYLGVDYLKPITPLFSAGFGAGYSKVRNEVETMSKGEVTMVPVFTKVRLMSDQSDPFVSIEGGLGHYLFDHTLSPETVQIFYVNSIHVEEKLEDTLGGFVGVGFNFFRRPNAGFGMNIQHHVVKPNLKVKVRSLINGAVARARERVDLSTTVVFLSFFLCF